MGGEGIPLGGGGGGGGGRERTARNYIYIYIYIFDLYTCLIIYTYIICPSLGFGNLTPTDAKP